MLFAGTVRGTPSPNKQVLSRPGSAGGTPGTVLRYLKLTSIYFEPRVYFILTTVYLDCLIQHRNVVGFRTVTSILLLFFPLVIIFHVHRNNLQGRHLIKTANTPGSYEAATPSGLGATGVTCSPMAMSSPILTTRSLESFISVVILQHLVSCTHGWCEDQGMKFKRLKMSKVCEVIKKSTHL